MSDVQVPRNNITLCGGGSVLVCQLDGQVTEEGWDGLFAGDTRVLSTYRLGIGGHPWHLLGRSQLGYDQAEWHYQNPALRTPAGLIPGGTIALHLRRRLRGVLHDQLRLSSFLRQRVLVRLTLQIASDFADIFEVHDQSIPPRPIVERVPDAASGSLDLRYAHRGFRRGLHVTFDAPGGPPIFAGAQVLFDLDLPPGPGVTWTCSIEATPRVDNPRLRSLGEPHPHTTSRHNHALPPRDSDDSAGADPLNTLAAATSATVETVEMLHGPDVDAPPVLVRPFHRGRADLRSLAIQQPPHPPYVAAGVPWFFTLFGRDPLVTALMAGLDGIWLAEGALAALAPRQAEETSDFHDAQPGKILHEARGGELSWEALIVASPYYYGTADAPSLFCLALWHAWRWTGRRALLDTYLPAARRALRWCEELGDLDGDGLLEYVTRSPRGYRNQGWKDAGDAIVFGDGRLADPPLATAEIQGDWYAARLAMAEVAEAIGDAEEASRLRAAAARQRQVVEDRFWMPEVGFYAQALDHEKRQVDSISSNPGQLLWSGLPDPRRAAIVAERLSQTDMYSGWGLRTLSSANPAYNPLAYQLGSVWPHDTLLTAAGLWRYGLHEAAGTFMHAILEAANAFDQERLPELFCGFSRAQESLPVPYILANSPQAWAAAAPILAVQLLLGIVPDAPHGRCWVAPDLPSWLPSLEVTGIRVGKGTLDLRVVRADDGLTHIEHLDADNIEVLHGEVEAPLWGQPPSVLSAGAGSSVPDSDSSSAG